MEESTRYIYLGKWFHFGKLYSLVRSQMTSSCLRTVDNKRLFSGSWCIFHTPHSCSFLEIMSSSLPVWHFLMGVRITNIQIGLVLNIDLGMLESSGMWDTSQPPVAPPSLYQSLLWLMFLSNLFTQQPFIKYLPWTGLVLGNVGGTTPTVTVVIPLSSQASRIH